MSTDPIGTTEPRFCGQCGKPTADQTEHEPTTHDRCAARQELEPPRYCTKCARRMVVQVVPTGWTARCSEHGTISSSSVTVTESPVTPTR